MFDIPQNIENIKSMYNEPFSLYKSRREFISPSDIKSVNTPSKYKHKKDNPEFTETRDTQIGQYFHALILETDKPINRFAFWLETMMPFPDKTYQNKANRQAREQFYSQNRINGKYVLTGEEKIISEAMYKTVNKSAIWRAAFDLSTGITERSFICAAKMIRVKEPVLLPNGTYAPDRYTDFELEIINITEAKDVPRDRLILLKCRPDYVSTLNIYNTEINGFEPNTIAFISDVKSSITAEPLGEFDRHAYKMGYHIQAAMYIDIVQAATNRRVGAFYFGAVEKTPPYDHAVFVNKIGYIEQGRYEYKKRLINIKLAINSGVYGGYEVFSDANSHGIFEIDIPNYKKILP